MLRGMAAHSIRVGIIGLGAIGQRLIRAFHAHPDFEVAALHDLDPERATAAASEFGGDAVTDVNGLINRVDLVYVAVPPAAHLDLTLAAFAAGRHVLCEKPLAVNAQDGEAMLRAAREAGTVHAMQLPLFFSPGVEVFAGQLRTGVAGEPRRADLSFVFPEWPRAWQRNPWIATRAQGGPVRECSPHLFEVIERTLGPVRRLRADVAYPADGVTSEDSALGVLELQSGLRVAVNVLCNVPRPEAVELTVYGTRATLGLTQWTTPVLATDAGPLQPLPLPDTPPRGLLDELASAIRGESARLPGLDVGLRLQKLQDAWEHADATGGWVTLDVMGASAAQV